MVRSLVSLSLAAALAASTAGCVTKGETGNIFVGGVDLTSLVQQVRDGVELACGFNTKSADILALVNNATINSVQEGVSLVCQGVDGLREQLATKRMAARPGTLRSFVIQRGGSRVLITGTFVQ